MKSLQKEQNSTNLLLWPPICRNKSAITPKWFNSLDTNSSPELYTVQTGLYNEGTYVRMQMVMHKINTNVWTKFSTRSCSWTSRAWTVLMRCRRCWSDHCYSFGGCGGCACKTWGRQRFSCHSIKFQLAGACILWKVSFCFKKAFKSLSAGVLLKEMVRKFWV